MERVNAFDREGRVVKVEERSRLDQEIREHSLRHGDADLAVECVYLMLVNAGGSLYIVQRAAKAENPWLWDKTVGGGVMAGDSPDATVLREAAEELGITAILVDPKEYDVSSRQARTKEHAIVRRLGFDPWFRSERVGPNGERWVKRHRMTMYAGRYDGEVVFADGEADALALLTLEDLRKAMQARPNEFTYDLRSILDQYATELKE